jgi:hypothetical protein
MPKMTAEDCWKKYRSLTNGITRDRDDLKKKLDMLYTAHERFNDVMKKMDQANGMNDDDIMALSTEAAVLVAQLQAARVIIMERASVRNPAAKLTMLPVWLKDNLSEMGEKLTAIMRDVRNLSPAEQAEFNRKAKSDGYPLDAITRNPKLAQADIRDIWKQYQDETNVLLKDWKGQADLYVKLEKGAGTSFAGKIVQLNKAIAGLTAILTAREKAKQKKAPPAPRIIKSIGLFPRPWIMSHH